MMTEKILVPGALSKLGQQIVAQLLAHNYQVRALVHDVDLAREKLGSQPELVIGDTRQPETIPPALENIRRVICATGTQSPLGHNSPKEVDFESVRNLVDAAQDAQVEHLILITTVGVTLPNHPLDAFDEVMTWKYRGEELVRQAANGKSRNPAFGYTIIRPGGLTDEPSEQRGVLFSQDDRLNGLISRQDLAEVCVQALVHPAARNTTFEVLQDASRHPNDWSSLFQTLESDKHRSTR